MTFPVKLLTTAEYTAYTASTWRLLDGGLAAGAGPLAVISGALTVDSFVASLVGSALSVAPGRGIVQGATTTTQGAYTAVMPTAWTATVPAASTLGRIDLVYLRVWDNETDSSGSAQADLVYLAGTPSGTPVAPPIPAGFTAFPICTITVPHTGSPSLTQAGVIPYTVAAGGVLPVANAACYPQVAEANQLIFNIATGRLMRWTGAGTAVPAKIGAFAPISIVNSASVPCTTAGTTIATLGSTLTLDGSTEIEIVTTWAGCHMASPVAGGALTFTLTLNGTVVDKWFYSQPTGPASNIATGGGSRSTKITPAAGTYTIAWAGIVSSTANNISVTAAANEITSLRVQPTLQ